VTAPLANPAGTQAAALRTSARRAPILAIAGAKGGVGKTMLATNLALLFARAGHRTLLVDFDPGCGDVAVHLRLAARVDLDAIAAGDAEPAHAVADGPAGLRVLLGRSGSTLLAGDAELPRARAFAAVHALAASHDVVVVDTGAGLGPATLQACEHANVVLGVTTPDLAALTDAYALAKVLHQRGRPLPQLVVNRVEGREQAMRTATRFAAVTRKFLDASSTLCGWIADDDAVAASLAAQRPLALQGTPAPHGTGRALADLRALAAAALATLPPVSRRLGERSPARDVRLRPASA
jgi:flagellar biosynthesis protein FlhG